MVVVGVQGRAQLPIAGSAQHVQRYGVSIGETLPEAGEPNQHLRPVRPVQPAHGSPPCSGGGDDTGETGVERFAEKWDHRYPMISASWIEHWEHIVPFLAFPADVRRVIYTTNTIEALNRQLRKIIKTRGSFPDQDAAPRPAALPRHRQRTEDLAPRLQLELGARRLPHPLRRPGPRHRNLTLTTFTPNRSDCYTIHPGAYTESRTPSSLAPSRGTSRGRGDGWSRASVQTARSVRSQVSRLRLDGYSSNRAANTRCTQFAPTSAWLCAVPDLARRCYPAVEASSA